MTSPTLVDGGERSYADKSTTDVRYIVHCSDLSSVITFCLSRSG